MPFAGRPVEDDVSAGAWLAAGTDGAAWPTVGALLPRGFAACCRVLHPAWRYEGDDDFEVGWDEVAADNGTVAHPRMTWIALTGGWEYLDEDSQPPVWDRAPDEGHLPTVVAARLAAVLRRHTATPDDCWFGVWTGSDAGLGVTAPTLRLPQREHWLVRGPVELAVANMADEPQEQSAHLWWPADRAWVVATDADAMSTYVAGTARLCAELAGTPGLDVHEAAYDDRLDRDGDPVNPVPPRD